MALLNPTVKELRDYLATIDGDFIVMVQADTEAHPNAIPEVCVVERWDEDKMILLAGVNKATREKFGV